MAWIGVITNAGKEVLAKWVDGKTLSIDSAMTGTGTVPEVSLTAQTDLVARVQEMSMTSYSSTGSGRKIKLQIGPSDAEYRMNQIGIWGSVDGASALLMIFQNMDGVMVYSAESSPDYKYVFYATLVTDNTGSLTVNIDTSTGVTYGEFRDRTEELDGEIGDLRDVIGGYETSVIEPGTTAINYHDAGDYFITAQWGYVRAETDISPGDELNAFYPPFAEEGNIEVVTVGYVLKQLNELLQAKAQINHASSQDIYGLGTSSLYGHVKTQSGDLNGQTETSGVAASNSHAHSQYLTSHQDISGKAPNNHASSATTYGIGTTANYGHVKIQAGDLNGQTAADGIAAARNHTHGQYLTSHQDISGKAPNNHASAATTYGIATTANYGHVKIQSGNLNGTSNTNGIAAGLGHTHSQYLTAHQDISGKAPNNHAVNASTYGLGTASVYGHVKLSDVYASSVGAAANAVGASQYALYSAYAALEKSTRGAVSSLDTLVTAANRGDGIFVVALSADGAAALTGTSSAGLALCRKNSTTVHMLIIMSKAGTTRSLITLSFDTSTKAITNRRYYGGTAF